MEIITMGIVLAIIAALLLVQAQAMAAQDMGISIPSNKVLMWGDPQMIYLTASAAITPGDNVLGNGSTTVAVCANNGTAYLGTADTDDLAVLTGDETSMTHDYASGERVGIITGNCVVRKIADTAGVNRGCIVRVGVADGAECQDISTGANKYTIGRALTSATSGNAFACHQF